MKLLKKVTLAAGMAIALLASVTVNSAQAAYPAYFETIHNGTRFHYVRVDLFDPNVRVEPVGANNRLPKYNANDPEPRWDNNAANIQPLLDMYKASPRNGKVALINTDYFCRDRCVGNAGAPQGMFVRNGIKYQWPGWHGRAALVIDRNNRASVTMFGPNNAPDPTNVSGLMHVVSGGPSILIGGNSDTCPKFQNEEDPNGLQCNDNNRFKRSGACTSPDGLTLWLIATSTDTNRANMASFMKSIHCKNGLLFDSRSSTSLVYQGSTKVEGAPVGTGLLVYYTGRR
jgi:Phosphodiester glycosidase